MDDGLKEEADVVLKELGMNMSSAFTIFVKQVVRRGALPFSVSLETPVADAAKRAGLDALLDFSAKNRKIESGYKFDRDACYDKWDIY
jgi:addiction module RelB/DinJ family antitoxin